MGYARHYIGMLSCTICGKGLGEFSLWQWVFDFLCLYIFGCFELFRQKCSWTASRQANPHRSPEVSSFQTTNSLILLTGCTSGIGLELLNRFLDVGLDVVAITHNRDPGLLRQCRQVVLDFGSTESTENACVILAGIIKELKGRRPVILIHCAAVFHPKVKNNDPLVTIATKTFAINLLMPVLFVRRLSKLLSGIIWIGSSSQNVAPVVLDVNCPTHAAKTPFSAYPLSKLLAFVFLEHWSLVSGKPAATIHPGVVATGLYRGERGLVGKILRYVMPIFAWTSATSAERILQLISETEFFCRLGKQCDSSYITPGSRPIYWDSVRMGPGWLPCQVRSQGQRNKIARALNHVVESYPTFDFS